MNEWLSIRETVQLKVLFYIADEKISKLLIDRKQSKGSQDAITRSGEQCDPVGPQVIDTFKWKDDHEERGGYDRKYADGSGYLQGVSKLLLGRTVWRHRLLVERDSFSRRNRQLAGQAGQGVDPLVLQVRD